MALTTYIRTSDLKRLIRDGDLEVINTLYPPHFDSIGDANIGNNDPDRPGAIATVLDGGETKIIIYQGDGTWEVGGGGGGITATLNNSLDPFGTTSANLDSAYPDAKVGDIVYSETNLMLWTKLDTGKWTRTSLDIV